MMIQHVNVRHARQECYLAVEQNVVQQSQNVQHMMIHVIVRYVKMDTKFKVDLVWHVRQ